LLHLGFVSAAAFGAYALRFELEDGDAVAAAGLGALDLDVDGLADGELDVAGLIA
jgi:hypothetical protein